MPLPLYYYIPNFGGIVLSEKQLKIIKSLCVGIEDAYQRYKKFADKEQMKKWQENFLWFFVNKAFKKVSKLDNDKDVNEAKKCFEQLNKSGVFDSYPEQWYELVCDIQKFINK